MITFGQFILEAFDSRVALLPGGFKPPHKGHLAAIQHLIDESDANAAIVFVGHSPRYPEDGPHSAEGSDPRPFTREQSKGVWEVYSNYISVPLEVILPDNPVRAVYEHIVAHPADLFYLGAGIEDQGRWSAIDTKLKPDGTPLYNNAKIVPIPDQFGRIRGTQSRDDICNNVWDCIPDNVLSPEHLDQVKSILSL
jgi:hypothetical protein